ncbi:hypothetical protein Godav_004158 [Gossypium davidsonii]|uniref:Uncharacterized protein n=1 Tax=Gossypium davidsonii TaxID=34287 RepID=A0A7J8SLT7_GOSDV|nr:hypothetical protein [Gossypium davidsonii]
MKYGNHETRLRKRASETSMAM